MEKIKYSEIPMIISGDNYTEFVEWANSIEKVFGSKGNFTFSFDCKMDYTTAVPTKLKIFSHVANHSIEFNYD